MTGWELFKRVLGSKNGKYHGIMGQLWDKCNEPMNKPWIQIASIMVGSKVMGALEVTQVAILNEKQPYSSHRYTIL
jgi:hypothetical protein